MNYIVEDKYVSPMSLGAMLQDISCKVPVDIELPELEVAMTLQQRFIKTTDCVRRVLVLHHAVSYKEGQGNYSKALQWLESLGADQIEIPSVELEHIELYERRGYSVLRGTEFNAYILKRLPSAPVTLIDMGTHELHRADEFISNLPKELKPFGLSAWYYFPKWNIKVYLRFRPWCLTVSDKIPTLVVSNVVSLNPRLGNYSAFLQWVASTGFGAVLIENADLYHKSIYEHRGFFRIPKELNDDWVLPVQENSNMDRWDALCA